MVRVPCAPHTPRCSICQGGGGPLKGGRAQSGASGRIRRLSRKAGPRAWRIAAADGACVSWDGPLRAPCTASPVHGFTRSPHCPRQVYLHVTLIKSGQVVASTRQEYGGQGHANAYLLGQSQDLLKGIELAVLRASGRRGRCRAGGNLAGAAGIESTVSSTVIPFFNPRQA